MLHINVNFLHHVQIKNNSISVIHQHLPYQLTTFHKFNSSNRAKEGKKSNVVVDYHPLQPLVLLLLLTYHLLSLWHKSS